MSSTTANPAVRRVVFSSATDVWATPQDLYDSLDEEFGFVLDPCANRANHKTPAWYGPDHPQRARRDGLRGDWAAEARAIDPRGAVWMNPPYGRDIAAWMAKAAATAAAGVTVVCLVPARTDTQWFHQSVLDAGGQIRFLRGRVKFGCALHGAPFASLVVVLRPKAVVGRVAA